MKTYSIFSHTLHSLLQLIDNKLLYTDDMTSKEVVSENYKFFQRAGRYIHLNYGYPCTDLEYREAAELLMLSIPVFNPNDLGI